MWQVIDYQEERSFTWASRLLPGLRVTGGHALTPNGGETEAQFWLEASGPLGFLLSPLLQRSVFKKNTLTATEGLKRFVEGAPKTTRA